LENADINGSQEFVWVGKRFKVQEPVGTLPDERKFDRSRLVWGKAVWGGFPLRVGSKVPDGMNAE
jgi:hypothetical protein